MKLSTKVRYGVRLMLDIAINYKIGPVLLKDISKRQEISEKYLWQIIDLLKNGGLVKSTRGAKGGYALAKLPSSITLKDIAEALEGPINLVECVKTSNFCKRSDVCISREGWTELNKKIQDAFQSITLEELMEKEKTKFKEISYAI